MGKEIVINAEKDQTRIAIVDNGELVEMYFEGPENERTIGDIYLGRIRRVLPNIQAGFIDIGQKSDAFLHFSDLSDNLPLILEFLSADKPEVGTTKITSSPHRRGRRHRPAHSKSRNKKSAAAEGGQGKAAGEKSDGKGKGKNNRARSAQERHRRKSAQKRSGRGRNDGDKQQAEEVNQPALESHLKPGAPLLVKIVKEPISNKGSRVSTDISLAGRFLVLVPLADYVAVSRRIFSYKERRRLRILAKSLLPKGFGLIVRTVAEGKNAKALDTDLRLLVEKWRKIEKKLQEKPKPPVLLHEDVSMVSSIIRDLFSEEYEKIIIDNPRLHRNVKSYVNAVAPHVAPRIKLHKSDKHVFAATGIDKSVQQAFESRVNLPSGGYLIIEHTEAMHVIDVNSGRAGKGLSQEENSLKVNLESAREIAKQLRLRDLGGIIVVDFIDLRDDRKRKKVHDELKKEFRKDRAVTKILPMSDFGVVQITRQRLRPSVTTQKDAPEALVSSNGTEPEAEKAVEVKETRKPDTRKPETHQKEQISVTPERLTKQIEERIKQLKKDGQKGGLVLKVHPFTGAFLTRNVPSLVTRWSLKYRMRLRLVTDEGVSPSRFQFLDAKSGKEIARPRDDSRRRGSSRRGGGRSKQRQPSKKSDTSRGS